MFGVESDRVSAGFVEHDGMGDSTLNAATEHLLVDVVKREHRDGSLHAIVLRRMNSQDGGRIRRQQTPHRSFRRRRNRSTH